MPANPPAGASASALGAPLLTLCPSFGNARLGLANSLNDTLNAYPR
ncbi:hypothetical protein SAMN05192543_107216 [Paraburkholderia megapolitana]|uniref:Uncharacterized protein n=1 Tax=Paraburkholderia megapolitana TaxID=420953 RepID=A0A1I3RIW6_9BURK|nr:hypothetical protein SAMN05192543_107216 [Paraburkholderia megapolitana]